MKPAREPLGAGGLSLAAAAVSLALGCLVILGWLLDSPALKGAIGVSITVKPNTALCFLGAGASLWLSLRATRPLLAASRALAAAVALLAGLTLSEHLIGWDLGIDQLLFHEPPGAVGTASPGRMGPPASLCFILLGLSLCFLDFRTGKGKFPLRYLPLTVTGLSLVSIAGYAFSSPALYSVHTTGIAWPTAVILFLLSLGVLTARPDNPVVQVLCAADAGGMAARRLIGPALAIPFLLLLAYGFIREAAWFDESIGRGVLAVIMMALLTGIVLITSRRLSLLGDLQAQAERRVRHNARELDDFFENALVCVHWLGADGIILRANKAELALLGYTADEYVGHHIGEFHADREEAEGLLRRLQAGESLREHPARLRSKDGAIKDVLIDASVLWNRQRFVHARCFTRDVTEQMRAAVTATRLSAIVESSSDAIVSKDLNGIVTSWNHAAELLFGYTAAEMIGRSITTVIPPERIEDESAILGSIRRGDKVVIYDAVRRRKSGELIDVSLAISPIHDANGRVVGASKIARDITERKRIDAEREALLESERTARSEAERATRLRDDFLAIVSHELRTPLNGILGWSQYLKGTETVIQAPDRTVLEGLDAIERGARAQAQLIEDLLDMNRITAGRLTLEVCSVDLYPIIEAAIATVRPAADGKEINLRTILDPNVGPVMGDPTRLQQVIWNLLANAVKFTPKGGRIDLCLREEQSQVEVTVTDTGMGIRPDFLPHVFDRFRQGDASTTRAYGGMGLGLSIVKNLVELHGGTVSAESEGQGRGATFIVRIPLSRIREDRSPRTWRGPPVAAEATDIDLIEVKVLVVDDDLESRELIKRVLAQANAEVVTAGSALEALQILSARKPDLLISDIGMPEMDGYQFIRRVRELPSMDSVALPAVALTAYARSSDRTRAMLAGYQVHIAKPIEPRELLATVATFTGRNSAGME